tara:strand:+ start:1936 stop:2238 length:303 start_codon:yes stop_codon:yes gene_type:complete
MKINTAIFTDHREFRLPYGIISQQEYHVWEVSRLSNSFAEYVHSPRKMKVTEMISSQFSMVTFEGDDHLTLFGDERYITNANQLDAMLKCTPYMVTEKDL